MTTLYHTSNQIVEHPDLQHSRRFLDFGVGFYLTPLREQAVHYGDRFKIAGSCAFLNTYILDFVEENFIHKRFEHYDEEWLEFVAANRLGLPTAHYDIVEGGIANDKVFNTVDLFFSGLITKEEALKRLLPMQPNWQICILNQTILDNYLHFQSQTQI